jgi:probable HAF family extracellular repeat protein
LPSYTPADLGSISGTGIGSSGAAAINAKHQVVGWSESPGAFYGGHGFLWDSGRLTDLGTLGGRNSQAVDINDAGQVVGWSQTASGDWHAFRWVNGVMTDLGFATQMSPQFGFPAIAVNTAGTVVGYTYGQSGYSSFVVENGVDLNLAALLPANSGWTQLYATGVNDAGEIVGGGTWNGQLFPFLYRDSAGDGNFAAGGGQIVPLLTTGSGAATATAINHGGQVAGYTIGSKGESSFLWTPAQANSTTGVAKTLGTLPREKFTSSRALGLNDAGDVVGVDSNLNHAVIWPGGGQVQDLNAQVAPVPSPSGYTPAPEAATAISNDGWIVGTGFFVSSTIYNDALLLLPGANAVPLLSINNVSVTEGHAGMTPANFTVTLSQPSTQTVTVDYATDPYPGGPIAGADYVATSGTLTFLPGEMTKTITVLVPGDTIPQYNQGFYVRLSNPTNALCEFSRGEGTIIEDDARLSISNVSVVAGTTGTTPCVFTVTLSKAASVPIPVTFSTFDGSAAAGSDYVATSGTLTFAPGETTKTITVPVIGDPVYEFDEQFYVRLSSTSPYAVFDISVGTGTIHSGVPQPKTGKNSPAAITASNPIATVLPRADANSLPAAGLAALSPALQGGPPALAAALTASTPHEHAITGESFFRCSVDLNTMTVSSTGFSTGAGHWTALGHMNSLSIDPAADRGVYTGTGAITTANGDQVFYSFTTSWQLSTGVGTHVITVTGGTGRFAGASGTGTSDCIITPDPASPFIYFCRSTGSGTLILPNGPV